MEMISALSEAGPQHWVSDREADREAFQVLVFRRSSTGGACGFNTGLWRLFPHGAPGARLQICRDETLIDHCMHGEDHGLAKLQGAGPLLADSKMGSPPAGLITAQALTGVLGVCLGVLGVCLGVWIYIYM